MLEADFADWLFGSSGDTIELPCGGSELDTILEIDISARPLDNSVGSDM